MAWFHCLMSRVEKGKSPMNGSAVFLILSIRMLATSQMANWVYHILRPAPTSTIRHPGRLRSFNMSRFLRLSSVCCGLLQMALPLLASEISSWPSRDQFMVWVTTIMARISSRLHAKRVSLPFVERASFVRSYYLLHMYAVNLFVPGG